MPSKSSLYPFERIGTERPFEKWRYTNSRGVGNRPISVMLGPEGGRRREKGSRLVSMGWTIGQEIEK
jgi:hypothetical protein